MKDVKNPATYDEQILKLKSNGCIISDEINAKIFLSKVNYYRLSAYFLPFKVNLDGCTSYFPGTSFQRIKSIYEFDTRIRELLLPIIEKLEIYLKTQLSYYHAHKYGSVGYLNKNSFSMKYHKHEAFLNDIIKVVAENKKAPCVKHHLINRDGIFPLWAIMELFNIRMVSVFYADLKTQDKKIISELIFDKEPHDNIRIWLKCLTELRNRCAHYSRLYYWRFSIIPPVSINDSHTASDRLFDMLMSLKYLYFDVNEWNGSVVDILSFLLEEYKPYICLNHIGFPDNWTDLLRKK